MNHYICPRCYHEGTYTRSYKCPKCATLMIPKRQEDKKYDDPKNISGELTDRGYIAVCICTHCGERATFRVYHSVLAVSRSYKCAKCGTYGALKVERSTMELADAKRQSKFRPISNDEIMDVWKDIPQYSKK